MANAVELFLAFSVVGLAKTTSEIEKLDKNLDKMDASAKRADKSSNGLGSAIKGMINPVTLGIGAFVGLGAGIKSVIEESMGAQQGQAALAAVLTSTNGAAGMTADAVNNLASKYQLVTKFSDDTILAGENLLLTFGNIGSDVFPETTAAMLNMATAMASSTGEAVDLKGTAIQLGKALNDPTKGLTALSKAGVSFTQQQKEQIKVMQEAGDMAGAQKLILAELEKEFGGAAEAAGKTLGGQLEILKHRLDEVKQAIGDRLLPIAANFVGLLNGPEVQGAITAIGSGIVGAFNFAATAAGKAKEAIGKFLEPLAPIKEAIGDIAGITSNRLIPALKEIFSGNFAEGIKDFSFGIGGIKNAFIDIGLAGDDFKGSIGRLLDKGKEAIGEKAAGIRAGLASALRFWETNGAEITTGLTTWLSGIGGSISTGFKSAVDWALGPGDGTPGSFQTWVTKTGDFLRADIPRIGTQIQEGFKSAFETAFPAGGGGAGFDVATLIMAAIPQTRLLGIGVQIGSKVVEGFPTSLPELGERLKGWGDQITTFFTSGQWKVELDNLGTNAEKLWKWIEEAAGPTLAQLQLWGGQLWNWFTLEGLPTLLTSVDLMGKELVRWIQQDAVPFLQEWGGKIWTWFSTEAIPTLLKFSANLYDGLMKWADEAARDIPGKLDIFRANMDGWFATNNPQMQQKQMQAFLGINMGITQMGIELQKVPAILDTFFADVNVRLSTFLNGILGMLSGKTQNISDGMMSGFMGALLMLPGTLLNFKTQVEQEIGNILLSIIKGVGSWLATIEKFFDFLPIIALQKLAELDSSFRGWAIGEVGKVIGYFTNIGTGIGNGIIAGIRAVWGRVEAEIRAKINSLLSMAPKLPGNNMAKGMENMLGLDKKAGAAPLVDGGGLAEEAGASFGAAIVNGIIVGFNNKFPELKTWLKDNLASMGTALEGLVKADPGEKLGKKVGEGIEAGVSTSIKERITAIATSFGTTVGEAMNGAAWVLGDRAGHTMVTGFQAGINATTAQFVAFLEGAFKTTLQTALDGVGIHTGTSGGGFVMDGFTAGIKLNLAQLTSYLEGGWKVSVQDALAGAMAQSGELAAQRYYEAYLNRMRGYDWDPNSGVTGPGNENGDPLPPNPGGGGGKPPIPHGMARWGSAPVRSGGGTGGAPIVQVFIDNIPISPSRVRILHEGMAEVQGYTHR